MVRSHELGKPGSWRSWRAMQDLQVTARMLDCSSAAIGCLWPFLKWRVIQYCSHFMKRLPVRGEWLRDGKGTGHQEAATGGYRD